MELGLEENLFEPISGKSLKTTYPELAIIPEFDKLQPKELLFVWWYACPSSPLVKKKLDSRQRALLAIKESYGEKFSTSIASQYASGVMPEHIRLAIERMSKFMPNLRSKTRNTLINIYNKLELINDIPDDFFYIREEGKVTDQIDIKKYKDYLSAAREYQNNAPDLIRKIEEGLGVSRKGEFSINKNGGMRIADHVIEEIEE